MRRDDYQDRGIAGVPLRERLAVESLWSWSGIDIVATRWHRREHPARSTGCTSYAAVEVMRTGSFEKRLGRGRVLADAGVAVFYNPAEAFEIDHPVGLANCGTTIRIGPEAFDAIAGRPRFRAPWARTPASFVLAVHRFLARAAVRERSDRLAEDETALALLRRAVALDGRAATAGDAPSATAQRRARTVQAFLNESYRRPLRLSDVAAAAECSVWHVARQFRQATGTSIHAAITRLRLRHALDEIRRGAPDLTRLALELGFSSHSHFSAAFRAEFGITPRAARCDLVGARGARRPRGTIR